MNFIHTADWHLGHIFKGRDRKEEHQLFLNWLYSKIIDNNIELLIISGDIFDNGSPPNYALKMYYSFLTSLNKTCCKNVVIVGGNHDSPSVLENAKELLSYINVFVVSSGEKDISNEIITLNSQSFDIHIGAVPYLRLKDLLKNYYFYKNEHHEFLEIDQKNMEFMDKYKFYTEGVKFHYKKILELIKKNRKDNDIVLLTGHMYVEGSIKGESERELFVGNTEKINLKLNDFDYFALGHIHRYQNLGNNMYYSGAPLPMNFKEISYSNNIIFGKVDNEENIIEKIKIPEFRKIIRIKGNKEKIEEKLNLISNSNQLEPWVEVIIENEEWDSSFISYFYNYNDTSNYKIISVRSDLTSEIEQEELDEEIDLEKITPEYVFKKIINIDKYDEKTRRELTKRFDLIMNDIEDIK